MGQKLSDIKLNQIYL